MYGIDFVDALAARRGFFFIASGDDALILYQRDAVTPQNLEDSWAAYRALLGEDGPDDGAEVLPFVPRSPAVVAATGS